MDICRGYCPACHKDSGQEHKTEPNREGIVMTRVRLAMAAVSRVDPKSSHSGLGFEGQLDPIFS